MVAPSLPHPPHQWLRSYALGELDDRAAEQVESHMKGCPDCRREVVETTSAAIPAPPRLAGGDREATSKGREPAPEAVPSRAIPPGLADHPDYRIIRELGRGGMGVVYLADNRLVGRDEVLKVIGRPVEGRPMLLDRFLREIRAVAKLRHPNIVAAYSAFRLDGGLVFAMEYVEGIDLARLVQGRGRLPVAHAVDFAHQVALGLQHAHLRGTVHRDIKPANLMLSHEGGRAVIKILDFGLAKVTSEQEHDAGLTGDGQMLGTPAYAAPEQIRDAQEADIRADIYSLGCTLHHFLAGEPPFRGRSLYDVLAAHNSTMAERLDLMRPRVPSGLATVVARMMAKDPDERFQSPGDVALALAPFLDEAGMAAEGTTAWLTPAGAPGTVGSESAPTQPATDLAPTAAFPVKPAASTATPLPFRRATRPAHPLVIGLLPVGVLAAGLLILHSVRSVPRGPFPKTVAIPAVRTSKNGGPGPIPAARFAPQPGWVPLFNGKDLRGWTTLSGSPDDWQVDGDVVRGITPGTSPRHAALGTTRADYADFRLRVHVRTREERNKILVFRSTGVEPDIKNYRFHLGGTFWNGVVSPAGVFQISVASEGDVLTSTEEGLKVLKPPSTPAPSPGTWHEVEVIARGNTFRMRMDGAEVAAYEDEKARFPRGRIEFRVPQGSSLDLRGAEILEFPGSR